MFRHFNVDVHVINIDEFGVPRYVNVDINGINIDKFGVPRYVNVDIHGINRHFGTGIIRKHYYKATDRNT